MFKYYIEFYFELGTKSSNASASSFPITGKNYGPTIVTKAHTPSLLRGTWHGTSVPGVTISNPTESTTTTTTTTTTITTTTNASQHSGKPSNRKTIATEPIRNPESSEAATGLKEFLVNSLQRQEPIVLAHQEGPLGRRPHARSLEVGSHKRKSASYAGLPTSFDQ